MLIDTPRRDMNTKREIKVKVPVSTHLRLHSLKLLHGQNISETIEAALTMYFDTHAARDDD